MTQFNQYPTPTTLPLGGGEQLVIAQTNAGVVGTFTATITQIQTPRQYTVATLPTVTSALKGQVVFATDGRNSGEGSGSGTGTLCFCNGVVWMASWSGVQVTS